MPLRIVSIALLSAAVSSCASYTAQNEKIRRSVYDQEYDDALKRIDKSEIADTKRHQVLYHLEKGTIFYVYERYKDAASEWAKATKRMEELYTVSVSSQAASLAVNESYADYEGEEHERILATTFSALAYFANNEPNKAIVEARKTNLVLKAIAEQSDGRNTYVRDAFSHYLAGLIYETKFEWDAAIVEYRSALDAAKANKTWMTGVAAETIAESLGRVAEFRRRNEIVSQIRSTYRDVKWTNMQSLMEGGEVYIVYEAGRSPIKVPEDIVVPVQGNVVRISFPRYQDLPYSSHGAAVLVGDKNVGKTVLMQDVGDLAKVSLSDRRGRDLVRMAARVLAKDQAARAVGRNLGPIAQLAASIFGAVTESADTRSWTLLPDTIQILRVPVQAGTDVRVKIQPDSGKPKEFVVNLRRGEKRLLRYRTFN